MSGRLSWVFVPLALTGCAGTMSLETQGCRPANVGIVEQAASRLVAPGQLRNGFTTEAGDRTFLSAELIEPDDDPDSDGVILTWLVRTGESLVAVDERARDRTAWPGSDDLDVRVDGAMSSRACVLEVFREP